MCLGSLGLQMASGLSALGFRVLVLGICVWPVPAQQGSRAMCRQRRCRRCCCSFGCLAWRLLLMPVLFLRIYIFFLFAVFVFYGFSVHCKVFCGFLRRLKCVSPCHFLRGINIHTYIYREKSIYQRLWVSGIKVKALSGLKCANKGNDIL